MGSAGVAATGRVIPWAAAIAAATRLPSAAARTIDDGPCAATSPPAKSPGIEVSNVTGSTTMKPAGVSSGGRSPKKSSIECWLIATISVSRPISNAESGTSNGTLRPEASRSPRYSVRVQTRPASRPSSTCRPVGLASSTNAIPSSALSRISSGSAGIWSTVRR